jgi:hypothetical protein
MAKESWRNVLPIHSAAALFPLMSSDELKALGEDIKANGLTAPIVLIAADCGLMLLDGRNRLDAMEAAGIAVTNGRGLDNTIPRRVLPHSHDAAAYVISANIHRRHLTAEERQDLLITLIARAPEKSDRQIGAEIGVDHKTIAKARAKGEDVGRIPHVSTRTDTKGRAQPAKHTRKPKKPNIEPIDAADAAAMLDAEDKARAKAACNAARKAGEISARLKNAGPEAQRVFWKLAPNFFAHDDIGPDSSGEADRLRARIETLQADKHRLEIENAGLRREIDELPAPIDELGALLRAWDRASESTREKFMARAGLQRTPSPPDPMEPPAFLKRERAP